MSLGKSDLVGLFYNLLIGMYCMYTIGEKDVYVES